MAQNEPMLRVGPAGSLTPGADPGVEIRRRWWRSPEAGYAEEPPSASWTQRCRREAELDLYPSVGELEPGRGYESVDELLELAESGQLDRATDEQVRDSALCWLAQGADMDQLAAAIDSGEQPIPLEAVTAALRVQQLRPDLDVYIEPHPVEFTDVSFTSPPGMSVSAAEVTYLTVVAENPRGLEQARMDLWHDPYRNNTVFDAEIWSGSVHESAQWQNWNPHFDVTNQTRDGARWVESERTPIRWQQATTEQQKIRVMEPVIDRFSAHVEQIPGEYSRQSQQAQAEALRQSTAGTTGPAPSGPGVS